MGRQALLILLSLLCFGGDIVSALADKRVALVIGNGRYVNAPTLSNPPNDAHAIANALATIGFEVIQGVDLDHDGMEKLLRDFLRRTSSAQVGLLFYAGHGIQVGGVNYLVPIDAKIRSVADLNFSAFDLDKVLASLDDPARASRCLPRQSIHSQLCGEHPYNERRRWSCRLYVARNRFSNRFLYRAWEGCRGR